MTPNDIPDNDLVKTLAVGEGCGEAVDNVSHPTLQWLPRVNPRLGQLTVAEATNSP